MSDIVFYEQILREIKLCTDYTARFAYLCVNTNNNIGKCFEAFPCIGCGKCCKDIHKVTLLKHESIYVDKKIANTSYPDGNGNYEMKLPCVFNENNRCKIYAHRPTMCKFFPFRIYSDEDIQKIIPDYNEVHPEGHIILLVLSFCKGSQDFLQMFINELRYRESVKLSATHLL